MRLDFHCFNCGIRICDVEFKGWSKIVCHKCKAKLFLKGTGDKYIIVGKRLLDSKNHRQRRDGNHLLFCPYCGKLIREIQTDVELRFGCPYCKGSLDLLSKGHKDEINIVVTKEISIRRE
jgi:phage FluMu protein Com